MNGYSENEFETFFAAETEATLKQCFEKGGNITLFPKGTSMLPTIVQGKDSVVLSKCEKITKNGIYLFKRPNGEFALHRLIKIKGENLIFCGDAQLVCESVSQKQLLAFVCGIYREGKRKDTRFSLKAFVFLNSFFPLRKLIIRFRSLSKRIKKG